MESVEGPAQAQQMDVEQGETNEEKEEPEKKELKEDEPGKEEGSEEELKGEIEKMVSEAKDKEGEEEVVEEAKKRRVSTKEMEVPGGKRTKTEPDDDEYKGDYYQMEDDILTGKTEAVECEEDKEVNEKKGESQPVQVDGPEEEEVKDGNKLRKGKVLADDVIVEEATPKKDGVQPVQDGQKRHMGKWEKKNQAVLTPKYVHVKVIPKKESGSPSVVAPAKSSNSSSAVVQKKGSGSSSVIAQPEQVASKKEEKKGKKSFCCGWEFRFLFSEPRFTQVAEFSAI